MRNIQKCNSDFSKAMLCIAVALPVACFFCMVWATLASLQENLTCHCLHLVHTSLIALRYGIAAANYMCDIDFFADY